MKTITKILPLILVACIYYNLEAQIPEFTRIDTGALASDYARGRGMYPVDFDNDGDLDLYIGNSTGLNGQNRPNLVYKNERNLRFKKITEGILAEKEYVTNPGNNWGDADNDGDWDLFNHGELYVNDGFGNFEISPNVISNKHEDCATWIDYNNDSYLDIFTNVFMDGNYMYKNNGDNTFTEVNVGSPTDNSKGISQSIAWSDFDNDGDLDLFESNFLLYFDNSTPANNNLYINNNDGTFAEIENNSPIVSDGLGANGAAWGDYDNDGDMDLYVFSTSETRNYLYRNEGDQNFERIIIEPESTIKKFTYSGTWGDFNNDGFLDLFIGVVPANKVLYTDCTFKENLFFINQGDRTFTRKLNGKIISDGAQALAANDFDNDGDLDLIITHGNLAPPYLTYIYANDGNENNWLNFTCEGRHSNRSAIGTRIRVKAHIGGNDVWMMRELSQENGMHTCNGAMLHFGLGDAENADSIIIHWPSAHIDTFLNIPPNQFYHAVEDSTLGIDFSAKNYIQYSPDIPTIEFFKPDTSTTIDLRNHFRLMTGDTVPDISGDTLYYKISSIDNGDLITASLDGSLLSIEPDSFEGVSKIHMIASTNFTSRKETIVIKNKDGIPPEIFLDITYLPDSIFVQSTEDGTIYLVPEGIDNRPVAIKFFSILSMPVAANSPVTILLDTIDSGVYWLYAADSNENISEPAVLSTTHDIAIEENEKPKIYPNPANASIIIESDRLVQYNLDIRNINGQLVMSEKYKGPKNEIDISSLPKGFYIITIKSRQFFTTEKLIKLE
jgi:hypothetical protein